MNRSMRAAMIAAGILLAAGGAAQAAVVPVLDQIGPNPTFVQGNGYWSSQFFEPANSAFNVALVDNFSIATPGLTLVEVDAALIGNNGFASYANITAYSLEVYSSLAAATSSLTGDVASVTVAPASVTLTTPYGTDPNSALVQIPINLALGVGSYYVSVIPTLNFSTGGQIAVYTSTYAGDSNAYQTNPNGGFGLPGNRVAREINAAYRILAQTPSAAVPEPSSLALCGMAGLVGLAAARTRRGRAA